MRCIQVEYKTLFDSYLCEYWKIETKNGFVSPPPISKKEADFMDEAIEGNHNLIYFYRKRRRSLTIDADILKEQMSKLPEFLKQPE